MIGSIDCMHWQWKNCPTALQGDYGNKKGQKSVNLEAVAGFDTWVWHAFFRVARSQNDLNVLGSHEHDLYERPMGPSGEQFEPDQLVRDGRFMTRMIDRYTEMQSSYIHERCQLDLMEHLWAVKGNEDE
ncbi:hypothetical protein L3X38_038045 [Prunus dulcis]|uniref:Uncharacterized protein n=1 Tax=Prunus dulcis TaxID=3755 RepID=A0AAD4YQ44_PRUDU|nr:hypothetical protein L3X38_038045 [Prunus dulcis]